MEDDDGGVNSLLCSAFVAEQYVDETTDRLHNRGCTHDDRCCLCHQIIESVVHLIMLRPFAKTVWASFTSTDLRIATMASTVNNIEDWWRASNQGPKDGNAIDHVGRVRGAYGMKERTHLSGC